MLTDGKAQETQSSCTAMMKQSQQPRNCYFGLSRHDAQTTFLLMMIVLTEFRAHPQTMKTGRDLKL